MNSSRILMSEAIDVAVSAAPLPERRLALGETLRRLLDAQIFVSYVCDPEGPYSDPVQISMGDEALEAYDRHFRHVDTLTPRLFGRHRASTVAAEPRPDDEFVRDFLHRRDMYHGLNYFAAQPVPGSIDLRLWRGRGARPFTETDARVLQSIGDLITRLWRAEDPPRPLGFTPRETEIVELVAEGWGDKQIAAHLGIAAPTLRTHLSHCFEKTGTRSRAGLASHYLRHRGG